MIIRYGTLEIDENEVIEKLQSAFDAMAHAQHEITEAQGAVMAFRFKEDCGTNTGSEQKQLQSRKGEVKNESLCTGRN